MKSDPSIYKGHGSALREKSNGGKIGLRATPIWGMSDNTILKALERMGYKGQMTGHGFRALAMSTIKEKLGYRHEVVDRQLAHAPRNKVDAAYDRAQFLDERGKMMQDWADYLAAMTGQEKIVVGNFRQVGFG